MIAADHSLRDAATAHAAATLRLVDLLRASRSAQWDRHPGEKLANDVGIVDETAVTATSTTRLRLRAAVLDAEAALHAATASLTAAADALEASFDSHVIPPTFTTPASEPSA